MIYKNSILIAWLILISQAVFTELSFTDDLIKKNTSVFFSDSLQTFKYDSTDTTNSSANGKVLYETKCQTCHPLFQPDDFTRKDWKNILIVMSEKSQLTETENKAIFNYLSRNSKK